MGSNEETTTAADPLPNSWNKGGKERKKAKKNRRRRRRWKVWAMPCFQVSCFGTGTPHREEAVVVVAEEGDRRHGASHRSEAQHSIWFWKRKAARTVPVDSSLLDDVGVGAKPRVETERGKEANLPVQTPAAAASLFRRLLAKLRWKKTRETGPSEKQPPEVVNRTGPHDSNADVGPARTISLPFPEASWMSADHRPGSHRTSDPPRAAAAAASSSSSSLVAHCPIFSSTCRKEAKPTKNLGETSTEKEEPEPAGASSASIVAGLIILTLLVLSLIAGGRVAAIVCTCTCFYLIPSFRGLQTRRMPSRSIATRRSRREGPVVREEPQEINRLR